MARRGTAKPRTTPAGSKPVASVTCGSLGGRGMDGSPCERPAPNGKDLCADHDEAAVAMRQGLKRKFLEKFSTGRVSREAAADTIGVGTPQVWRWRQADAAFDAAVKEAEKECDGHRVNMVEDSLFARIVAGKAHAGETIFYLVNRSHGRWRHIQTIQHSGPGGGPIQVEEMSPQERAHRVEALLAEAATRVTGNGKHP